MIQWSSVMMHKLLAHFMQMEVPSRWPRSYSIGPCIILILQCGSDQQSPHAVLINRSNDLLVVSQLVNFFRDICWGSIPGKEYTLKGVSWIAKWSREFCTYSSRKWDQLSKCSQNSVSVLVGLFYFAIGKPGHVTTWRPSMFSLPDLAGELSETMPLEMPK